MASPVFEKLSLWRESGKGLKTRLDDRIQPSVVDRPGVSSVEVQGAIERGDFAQRARLNHYPSIDVSREQLFAGRIDGDLEEARERLFQLGYRNNPTAYVEVTEETGPDDGSYARQYVTETGVGKGREYLSNYPTLWRRLKRQIHVCIWDVGDGVEFLAHDEKSAWLQPMLHVAITDVKARRGVQEFRLDWYDEFGEELPGRDEVNWEVAH